jgi:hypothetical protein
MPFKSQAQRAYMYIHHPEIAKEFESATPKGKKLPKHVKKNNAVNGVVKGLSK